MLFIARVKEFIVWQYLFVKFNIILGKLYFLNTNSLQNQIAVFSPFFKEESLQNHLKIAAQKLAEFVGVSKKDYSRIAKQLYIWGFLFDQMIIDSKRFFIESDKYFPFSLQKSRNIMHKYYKEDSLIILVYHMTALNLLVKTIGSSILYDSQKDIVIFLAKDSMYLADILRSYCIETERLKFVHEDKKGLLALRKHLKQGAFLFFMMDIPQPINSENSSNLDFLNYHIRLSTGILRLSCMFNTPILPIIHHLNPFGLQLKSYPIMKVNRAKIDSKEKLDRMQEKLLLPLLTTIKKYPYQWFQWHRLNRGENFE